MTGREAIRIVFSFVKEEPVVVATGHIARAAQAVQDRDENFYVIGSMGMVCSIASGIAIARPTRKVIALDGDGAVLMNLGALPTAVALGLTNLVHIVIDNRSYESTGGQPTFTNTIRLEKIAKASGYRFALSVSSEAKLQSALPKLLKARGPSFLLVRVEHDAGEPAPRVKADPEAITRRFAASLS